MHPYAMPLPAELSYNRSIEHMFDKKTCMAAHWGYGAGPDTALGYIYIYPGQNING